MSRLFVDCDDTLVLWDNAAEGSFELYNGSKWELNHPLIGDIACFLGSHPEYELVVWSGGGIDYAQRWAEKAFVHHNFSIAPKDMRVPSDKDICVDDMYGEMEPRDKRVRVVPNLDQCPVCNP